MRRACIDIGSNTTRLLVADCDGDELVEVHQERAFTRIGGTLDQGGAIPASTLAEVVSAVTGQLASARREGATAVRCVATAGVRRAANGQQLVAMIGAACESLAVEVLSGEDEARLAFIGAAWGLRRSGAEASGALGVVDVGGGSSELVVGEPPDRIDWCRSLPIGSSDLAGACLISDPPTAAELARARACVRETFAGAQPPAVTTLLAVGGSAASLTRIVGSLLDATALGRSLALIESIPALALAERFAIDLQRLRLLPGGLLILEHVSELFGLPLLVGSAGLREGLLLDATSGCP